MINKIFIPLFTTALIFISCDRNNPNLDGQRIYKDKCLNCHQEKGQGVGKLIPPLTDTKYLLKNRAKLPCIIQNGLQEELHINSIFYSEKMPKTENLTNADMVNILNYIGQNWGNDLKPFTMKEVETSLTQCE